MATMLSEIGRITHVFRNDRDHAIVAGLLDVVPASALPW
jgi:hypothetical protein